MSSVLKYVDVVTVFALLCISTPVWGSQGQAGDSFYAPSLNEIYKQAKVSGISEDWSKSVRVTSKNFDGMSEQERAFKVGVVVSHSAFLILDKNHKETGEITGILKVLDGAIQSMNPPASIRKKLQELQNRIVAKELVGEDLRIELDSVISQYIPSLQNDPKFRDSATLLWSAGFFRAMHLGVSTVSSYPNPTQEQLALFRYGAVAGHVINYFKNKASPSYMSDQYVSRLVTTLEKIKPILEKKPQRMTKDDISDVSKYLGFLFR